MERSSRGLHCPACKAESGRGGSVFVGEWAIAAHVAGCVLANDKLHTAWVHRQAPNVNLVQSLPKLAGALLGVVHQAIEANRPKDPTGGETPIAVLHRFERKLRDYVRARLQAHFGAHSEAWWVDGVPLPTRQVCAQRREADRERCELFEYTYLIDLKSIMDNNWALFDEDQARLRTSVLNLDKKQFLNLLARANGVRTRHAHLTCAPESHSDQYSQDLQAARALESLVDLLARGSR